MDVSRIILTMRKLKLVEKIVLKSYQKRLVKILRMNLVEANPNFKLEKFEK